MKYTYFGGVKSGKFLIRSLFQYNKKSYSYLSAGYSPFALITKPIPNGYHTNEWYWEDARTHKIKYWNEVRHLETLNEVMYQNEENMFPLPTGYWGSKLPQNLYKIFPLVYESDIVVNPLTSLGYCSGVGSRDMNWNMRRRRPPMNIDLDFTLKELRSRRNIVAYKENTYHWVRNFFLDGNLDLLEECGEDAYVDYCTRHINNNKTFAKLLISLLEYYKIPYEKFSLDTGDYCKTFGLTKNIDRSSTNDFFIGLPPQYHDKVKTWTENYLQNN